MVAFYPEEEGQGEGCAACLHILVHSARWLHWEGEEGQGKGCLDILVLLSGVDYDLVLDCCCEQV